MRGVDDRVGDRASLSGASPALQLAEVGEVTLVGGNDSGPPPLGDYYIDPDRTCMRLVGFDADGRERLCGKPSVLHVDWGDACGFVCEEHRGDLERWSYRAAHDLGGNCGMPGAAWYDAAWEGEPKSWCAVPGDGPPVVEPVRAITSRVSA